MRMGLSTIALCAVACLHAGTAGAQSRITSLDDVLSRARERAPEIVSARLAIDEARGRLAGASLRAQTNPEIDFAIGNRSAPGTRYTDFELAVAHTLEPGARRGARVDAANAAIARGTADADEATRNVLRAAAAAYFRVVHAGQRIGLLTAAEGLASTIYANADRRFRAGDIAVLDVNIARASLARVKAEREGAEAARALAIGDLRQLLRLEPDVVVAGTLARPEAVSVETALQTAAQRPELRALEAAIQEAEADVRFGLSMARTEYGVGMRYSREEGDQIVLGGMTVTLPAFSRGQAQRATASARAARLRAELEATRARVDVEVRAAADVLTRRIAAVRVLEADAIPGLDDNEQLSTRSFEVGQIGLPELLLIRREILDTRSQYLDALLEAALARTDLDASAGVLR
jgi:cobalt-zinc-cadmium efflux system outer membrane protein